MTDTWTAQDARTHFGKLLDAAIAHGPQIVTRRGVAVAALVSVEHWRSLQERARPTIKDWLLAPHPRTENLTPPRKKYRRHKLLKV